MQHNSVKSLPVLQGLMLNNIKPVIIEKIREKQREKERERERVKKEREKRKEKNKRPIKMYIYTLPYVYSPLKLYV